MTVASTTIIDGIDIIAGVLRGDVEKSDASAMTHFERIISSDQLAARALELAVDARHPIYDCLRLAVAAGDPSRS
jgi:hypothetical protein